MTLMTFFVERAQVVVVDCLILERPTLFCFDIAHKIEVQYVFRRFNHVWRFIDARLSAFVVVSVI